MVKLPRKEVKLVSSWGESANQGVEGARLLVFGAIGDKLKSLDSKRVLAIIQQNPDYYLCSIGNIETELMIDELVKWAQEIPDDADPSVLENLPKSLGTQIRKVIEHDALFAEIAEFLHTSGDILAAGSFVTGEFQQKQGVLKTMGKVTRDE